jgi:ribosome recycling factor
MENKKYGVVSLVAESMGMDENNLSKEDLKKITESILNAKTPFRENKLPVIDIASNLPKTLPNGTEITEENVAKFLAETAEGAKANISKMRDKALPANTDTTNKLKN